MKLSSHMKKKPRKAFLEIPPFGRNDCPQDDGNGGIVGGCAAHNSRPSSLQGQSSFRESTPKKKGHNAKMTVNKLPILALRSTQFDRPVFSVIYLISSIVPKD